MDANADELFRPFGQPSTWHDPHSLIDPWCPEDEFLEAGELGARTGSGEERVPEPIRSVLKRWFDQGREDDVAATLGKLTDS
jgi:hypothetical protein